MNLTDDTDADYAGMTLTEVYTKHRKLRGSDLLKYPPTRGSRCQTQCGLGDMVEGELENRKAVDHQCFYAPAHDGDCQFSSECGKESNDLSSI